MPTRAQLLERAHSGWLEHLVWEGEPFEIKAGNDGTFLIRPGTIGSVLKVGTTGSTVFHRIDGPRELDDGEMLVLFEGALLSVIRADGPWRALDLPSDIEMRQAVDSALLGFLEEDYSLLTDDVNERTITARFAHHLEKQLPEWHVDCEYNRAIRFDELEISKINEIAKGKVGLAAKMIFIAHERRRAYTEHYGLEGHKIYPDIIVHRRQSCCNLLVIEAKKNCGSREDSPEKPERAADISKLNMIKEQLGYRFGAFVSVATGKRPSVEEVHWVNESQNKPGGPLCYASVGFQSEPQFVSAGEGPANVEKAEA